MHKDFSEWYRIAKIEPKEEWLTKRWDGVEKISEKIDSDQSLKWLELVRIFYLNPAKNKDFMESYSGIFQHFDKAFPMRDNQIELSILSGAAIVNYIQNNTSDTADALALATVCTDCQGMAPLIPVAEIKGLAQKYLSERSANLQRIEELPTISELETDLIEKLKALPTNAPGSSYTNSIHKPIRDMFNSLVGTLESIEKNFSSTRKVIESRMSFQQEETNILWWVFGGYSRDLEKPMTDFEVPAASLIAGKELADLITNIPGPFSARAFLDKILFPGQHEEQKPVTIKDAVNKTPKKWRERLLQKINIDILKDFCPVLCAVKSSVETDGQDDWLPFFKKSTQISPEKEIGNFSITQGNSEC
jgi:hypothetical protein